MRQSHRRYIYRIEGMDWLRNGGIEGDIPYPSPEASKWLLGQGKDGLGVRLPNLSIVVTVRLEKGNKYWYGYKRWGQKLYKVYLGKELPSLEDIEAAFRCKLPMIE
jgi:hypothetical protein